LSDETLEGSAGIALVETACVEGCLPRHPERNIYIGAKTCWVPSASMVKPPAARQIVRDSGVEVTVGAFSLRSRRRMTSILRRDFEVRLRQLTEDARGSGTDRAARPSCCFSHVMRPDGRASARVRRVIAHCGSRAVANRVLLAACCRPVPDRRSLGEKSALTWCDVWMLSGRRGSNPRPQPWQGCALPTEPRPRGSRNLPVTDPGHYLGSAAARARALSRVRSPPEGCVGERAMSAPFRRRTFGSAGDGWASAGAGAGTGRRSATSPPGLSRRWGGDRRAA
jgi:hypothetical protein